MERHGEQARERVTVDGFGIRTTYVEGLPILVQQSPGEVATILHYDTAAEAAEAFDYVAARSHYGRELRRGRA